MIDIAQKVRPNKHVVFTELENDEIILLHLETKSYFSLNETGTVIWQHLAKGLSLQEVVSEIQNEFDVETSRAEKSVLNLVNELINENLVEIDINNK